MWPVAAAGMYTPVGLLEFLFPVFCPLKQGGLYVKDRAAALTT